MRPTPSCAATTVLRLAASASVGAAVALIESTTRADTVVLDDGCEVGNGVGCEVGNDVGRAVGGGDGAGMGSVVGLMGPGVGSCDGGIEGAGNG